MAEIVCDLDLERARGRVALPLAGGVVWRGVVCWSVGDSRRIAVSTGLGLAPKIDNKTMCWRENINKQRSAAPASGRLGRAGLEAPPLRGRKILSF